MSRVFVIYKIHIIFMNWPPANGTFARHSHSLAGSCGCVSPVRVRVLCFGIVIFSLYSLYLLLRICFRTMRTR